MRISGLGDVLRDIRLIFNRYSTINIQNSLKARTRQKRTSGKEILNKLSDPNDISNVSLRKFFSHIGTKQQLIIYLSKQN